MAHAGSLNRPRREKASALRWDAKEAFTASSFSMNTNWWRRMVSLVGTLESLRGLRRSLKNLTRTKNGLLAELAATGHGGTSAALQECVRVAFVDVYG
eukprot:267318-Prymnesium_polylepis.1